MSKKSSLPCPTSNKALFTMLASNLESLTAKSYMMLTMPFFLSSFLLSSIKEILVTVLAILHQLGCNQFLSAQPIPPALANNEGFWWDASLLVSTLQPKVEINFKQC